MARFLMRFEHKSFRAQNWIFVLGLLLSTSAQAVVGPEYEELMTVLTQLGQGSEQEQAQTVEHAKVILENSEKMSKINLNEKRSDGWFPLGLAAAKGNADIVALLMNKGAKLDVSLKYEGRQATPFILAAQNNRKDVMARILNSPQFDSAMLAQESRNASLFKQPNLKNQLTRVHQFFPWGDALDTTHEVEGHSRWDHQASAYRTMDSSCKICLETPGTVGESVLIDGNMHTGNSATTPCCGQDFCEKCLKEGSARDQRCPFCRTALPSGSYHIILNAIEEFHWLDSSAGGISRVPLPGEVVAETPSSGGVVEGRIENIGGIAGLNAVALPGGTFDMGTPAGEAGRYNWEEYPHRVTVGSFKSMDTHITRRQWMAVMGRKPALQGCYKIKNWDESEMDLPANGITAYEADAFVEKLKSKLNGNRLIPRLISSAEAEYLARLGADKQIHAGPYPFPERELGNYAVYDGSQVQKVRSKRPIAGIYDARGNVYTWTSDLYDRGPRRVLRGGSFAYKARFLRSGSRDHVVPSNCYAHVGVRLIFH